jgi:hypothetical protein
VINQNAKRTENIQIPFMLIEIFDLLQSKFRMFTEWKNNIFAIPIYEVVWSYSFINADIS